MRVYHLYSDGELVLTTECKAQLVRRAKKEAQDAVDKYGRVSEDTVYYTEAAMNVAGTTSGCKDFKFKMKVEDAKIEEASEG